MNDSFDWKIALRTGLGAALTWVIDQRLTEMVGWTDRTISGLWAVISAIIVLQSSLGGGYLEGYKRFTGIFVGSLFGGIATTLIGANPLSLAFTLFFVVLSMDFIGLQASIRIASLSCAVVMVVWSLNPIGSPWVFAIHRFLDSCLGLIIGLLFSHFLFPSETTKALKQNKKTIFSLFSSALKGGKPEVLQQAQNKLNEDEQLIHELRAEWTQDTAVKERWETFHNGEKNLLNLLKTATSLPHEELFSLLDPSFQKTTKEAIANLEQVFEMLGEGKSSSISLVDSAKRIKEERLRYREVRATRPFTYSQLENYFVYYYALEELLLETNQLQELT